MRTFRRFALLASLCVSTVASAQAPLPAPGTTASGPESRDSAGQARTLFLEGVRHYEAQRYREAIDSFEQAATVVPSADLWFNIARAYEQLGELESAVEYYRRYLRDRVDPPDRVRIEQQIEHLEERAEAERLATRRAPTTGSVRIEANVEGARVAVDGAEVGTTPIPFALAFGEGRHELRVEREGFVPFRASFRVDAGGTTLARAELAPTTVYRSVRGRRRWTWVVASLGVAALGTSIGLGAHAVSLERDGAHDEARRWATRSDYALGGGLVAGLGAVLLYFAEGRSIGTERIENAP